MVEDVEMFKCMGRTLDQTDYDWLAVRQKIMRARSVWGMLGEMLRQ